jgi:SAM-dependent methyltransferase
MEKQLEEKWEEFILRFLKPVGDELINILEPEGNELILDVASGTGGPGLSIAARMPAGKAVLTPVSALPFEDNTFDAISFGFGLTLFTDVLRATKEMCRVLKPGGKIAVSVWDVAEKNPWLTTILDVIYQSRRLSDPLPEAPDVLRCAEDGYLVNLFIQGGFKNIQIGAVSGKLVLPSAEMYWEMMTEVEPTVSALLEEVDPARIAKIKYELYESLDQKFRGNRIQLASSALVLFARKRIFHPEE